jgi:sigma-B regulation protein RsbU (phosphoserine phosphatase)
MMKKSALFTKTLQMVTAIFVVFSVVVALVFSVSYYTQIMDQYEYRGRALAESIADSAVDILLNQDAASIQSRLSEYSHIEDVAYILVVDTNNEVIAHTFTPYIPEELVRFQTLLRAQKHEGIVFNKVKVKETGERYIDVMAPVLNGELAYVHVGMATTSILHSIERIIALVMVLLALLFVCSIFVIRIFVKQLSSPLQVLTHYSEELAKHHFNHKSSLSSDVETISQKSNDEIGQLAKTFLQLEDSLISYIADLEKTLGEKSKLENELSIAKKIQEDMLLSPNQLQALNPNVSLVAYMKTMKEVGGDFYDAFIKNDHLYVVMGDVSGKGVSAALFMSASMTVIRSLANHYLYPSELLFQVNQELCAQNANNLFVTLFIAAIDLESGLMTYCNAGHPAPFIKHANYDISELPYTGGMALGIEASFYYEEQRFQLKQNDIVLLYTDGITEAMNENEELYSEQRLSDLFKNNHEQSLENYKDILVESVFAFANSSEQADDITLLLLEWHLKETIEIGAELKVHFLNEISEIEKLQYVVEKYSQANDLPEELTMQLNLVLEELLSNTIFYGYQDHEKHYIYVHFILKSDRLTLVLEDDGIAFNPLERSKVDTTKSIEDVEVGGLGIHFVKNLMDHIEYKRDDNKNFLTLEKIIKKQSSEE